MTDHLSSEYTRRDVLRGNAVYLLLALAVLALCSYTATQLHMSQCPDEAGRYLLPQFLYSHGQLPYGWEPEVRIEDWGFSYAFMPYLPAILSACLMRIAAVFGAGEHGLLVAARLVSALCVAGAAFVACKLGEKVTDNRRAGLLCGVVVGCTPQVIFIGSYVNNDAMALLAVLIMVYAWALGCLDDRVSDTTGAATAWSPSTLVLMALGMSLALLSYYNSYGFVLFCPIVFVAHARRKGCSWNRIVRGLALVAFVAFLLAGWHFIRNLIIYQGDLFGMRMRREFAERYAIDKLKPGVLSPRDKGLSPWETFVGRQWFAITTISFFCVTGFLDVHAPIWVYLIYVAATAAGMLGCFSIWRNRHHGQAQHTVSVEMIVGLVCACAITIALAMWYSYATDFQPQGRYIFGCMSAYTLIVTCGIDRLSQRVSLGREGDKAGRRIDVCTILSLVWIVLLVVCYFGCLVPCFLPRA